MVLLVCVAVASAIAFGWWASSSHREHHDLQPARTAAAIAGACSCADAECPTARCCSAARAAALQAAPTRDFLASMHADNIPYTGGDDDAIVSAHQVCNYLADRRHPSTMSDQADMIQHALGWPFQQSEDFVTGAVKAYCPEQARLKRRHVS